jgi:hypothetical protein
MCCDKSLAHPMRVRFSFIGSSHDRNISRQTTENLTIGVALKHCQASGYVWPCALLANAQINSLLYRIGRRSWPIG